VAGTDSTVLIVGETGTGKELAAEALHRKGPRAKGPLIKVNCSALSETILESELFGHVRGAFSGAVKDNTGRIQAAEGGSLFLDEIGEISPHIQIKLLRFLESREYERVGESKTRKADVRIIAATNTNLEENMKKGIFRSDLYYRLNIMTIHLPPLREREGDILLLVDKFVRQYARLFRRNIRGLDDEVTGIFLDHPWPGNVRELKHMIEHACLLCRDAVIRKEHLPRSFRTESPSPKGFDFNATIETVAPVIGPEQLIAALKRCAWQKAGAARLLGIDRSTVYRKMKRYGIDNNPAALNKHQ